MVQEVQIYEWLLVSEDVLRANPGPGQQAAKDELDTRVIDGWEVVFFGSNPRLILDTYWAVLRRPVYRKKLTAAQCEVRNT